MLRTYVYFKGCVECFESARPFEGSSAGGGLGFVPLDFSSECLGLGFAEATSVIWWVSFTVEVFTRNWDCCWRFENEDIRGAVEELDHLSSLPTVTMKLMLRPEWRPRPFSSFLGCLDLKTGVVLALLFAVCCQSSRLRANERRSEWHFSAFQ